MARTQIDPDGTELTATKQKGNKQWAARITGTSSQYGLEREWITPYGRETSGSVQVAAGDVIERATYSRGGREKDREYWVVAVIDGDAELVEIDADDVEDALVAPGTYLPNEEDDPRTDGGDEPDLVADGGAEACEECGAVNMSIKEELIHDIGCPNDPATATDGGEDDSDDEPTTTDDLDDVAGWAGDEWGDGHYDVSPREVQQAVYETAIEADGLVPREDYVSADNEGYEAALYASVYVSDPEEYEWRLAETLDELTTTLEWDVTVAGGETGDGRIEDFRAAASDVGLAHEETEWLVARMLRDDHEAIAERYTEETDDERLDAVVETAEHEVDGSLYDETLAEARDTETWTVETTLRDLLVGMRDVYPETRSLPPVSVTVRVRPVEPYYG